LKKRSKKLLECDVVVERSREAIAKPPRFTSSFVRLASLFLRPDLLPACHRAERLSGMAAGHREAAPQASLTGASTVAG
jgi:hypothetical protein